MENISTSNISPTKSTINKLITPPGCEKTKAINANPKRKSNLMKLATDAKKMKSDFGKQCVLGHFSYDNLLKVENGNGNNFYFTNAKIINDVGPFKNKQEVYPIVDFKEGIISISVINFQRQIKETDLRKAHSEIFKSLIKLNFNKHLLLCTQKCIETCTLDIYDTNGILFKHADINTDLLCKLLSGFKEDQMDYRITFDILDNIKSISSIEIDEKTGIIKMECDAFTGQFFREKENKTIKCACWVDLNKLKFTVENEKIDDHNITRFFDLKQIKN